MFNFSKCLFIVFLFISTNIVAQGGDLLFQQYNRGPDWVNRIQNGAFMLGQK